MTRGFSFSCLISSAAFVSWGVPVGGLRCLTPDGGAPLREAALAPELRVFEHPDHPFDLGAELVVTVGALLAAALGGAAIVIMALAVDRATPSFARRRDTCPAPRGCATGTHRRGASASEAGASSTRSTTRRPLSS